MKKIIILELVLLIMGTTFQGDSPSGWFQQTLPSNTPVADLYFLDSLTGFVLARKSTSDSSFIYKTTDGGNNWNTVYNNSLFLSSIQFTDINTGYSVGATDWAFVLKTTDNGNNWFAQSYFGAGQLDDICFVNNDTGWTVSTHLQYGGIFRTTNGGQSWQQQLGASSRPSRVFFINHDTGWAICNSQSDVYKTTNSGLNWNFQSHFLAVGEIFFSSNDTGWIIGGKVSTGSGLMITTDGGNNWYDVNTPEVLGLPKLFFIDNKKGWAGHVPNNILATIDGINWGYQYSPIWNSNTVYFVDSIRGWAGYSGLVKTTDGGGVITDVKNNTTEIPKDYFLEQNYPNPFNSITNIKFQMINSGIVEIKVFDISGKILKILTSGKYNTGEYIVRFDSGDLPSGIYFYRMETNNYTETKKMILLK